MTGRSIERRGTPAAAEGLTAQEPVPGHPHSLPEVEVEDQAHRRRGLVLAAYATAITVDLAATAVRLEVTRAARFAGHADPSFYFQFARNLAEGRGPTVDFVWHFLVQPPSVHHYAPDYWQPLPSILMAAAMRVTGSSSLSAALTASVLAAALVPVATALLARGLTTHPLVPPTAMGLTALVPVLANSSVQAESIPFYTLFVLLAFALACRRSTRRIWWLLAGVAASAAYLCRNDGLLLLAMLNTWLAAKALSAWRRDRHQLRAHLANFGLFAAGMIIALAPWVSANLHGMGRPIPPTTRLAFLTTYDDMFAIGKHDGISELLASGMGRAVSLRYHTAVRQVIWLARSIGIGLTVSSPVLVGAWVALSRRRGTLREHPHFGWPLLATSAAVLFSFHAMVSPVASSSGAWRRSLVAFVPVLVIALVHALFSLTRSSVLRGAVITALAVPMLLSVHSNPARAVEDDNQTGSEMARLKPLLSVDAPSGRPVVVMTRNPWELTEATGIPAVQVPNNDLCTILGTARRYEASMILLPVHRHALRDPAQLRAAGFTFIARQGAIRVYRIPAADPACS